MKKILIFSALFLLASVSLSAQVVKGAGLWYFNGLPNVTPSVATGTEIAYSINNKALFKWNRTTSAWVAVVQDSSITNELQDLILSNDTLSLTLSDSVILMAQYRNHVWEITNLSDTTSITGDIEGDIAYTSTGDTIAFRGASAWLPFTGGGGGGTFNSFNIAGDTGSDIVTDGQTVTIAGGYGINTAETGGTVTVTADTSQLATQSDISGFGTMSSFTVAGGSGTPQTITNGNTLIMSEGYGINTLAAATDNVRTEVDTTQIATQNDISGLPSGTGTNQRIVVWTGTNSQGNSTQLQSAAGVTLDANLAYRITGGTTASRPTGAAGMMYWNTSNNWFDYHNGTSWFNPARSATTNGLFTAGSVLFAHSDGTVQQDAQKLFYNASNDWFGVGTNVPLGELHVEKNQPAVTGIRVVNTNASGIANLRAYAGAASFGFGVYGNTATAYGAISAADGYVYGNLGNLTIMAETGGVKFATGGTAERMRLTTSGRIGIGTTTPASLLDVEGGVSIGATYSGTTAAPSNGAIIEGSVGIGTNAPALKLDVRSTAASTTGVFSLANTTVTTPLKQFATNATPQSAIIGSPGDIAFSNAGFAYLKESGSATNTGWAKISTTTDLGAYLPLTLTGTTEVNTAGQNLYFRDAAGYPFTFMNSNYFLAASGVNNYIDVGSTASNVKIISDGLIELNSSVNTSLITTGRLLVDSDSIVIDATLPVNTNATHVLVRDAVTERVEEKAISSFGNGIISALPLSTVTIITENQLVFNDTSTASTTGMFPGSISFEKDANAIVLTNEALAFGGSLGVDGRVIGENGLDFIITNEINLNADYVAIGDSTAGPGVIRLKEDSDNGTNYGIIKAPDNLSANPVFTTPATNGNAKGVLETDGSGVTAWTNAPQVYNLVGNSAAPGLAIANAGSGATVTGYSAESSAVSGRFTFTTGTGAMAGGSVINVTFPVTLPQVGIVQIGADGTKDTAGGLAAAVLIGAGKAIPVASTGGFVLYVDATGLANSTRYDFTYTVSSAN